ncbi:basal transcriptional activator hABT1 and RRM domain-containing protein [Cryptosporidium canis]|uniref:Basal transcriptional activator hABT1 and RRM domain-containing protein n=1 Tax=Cryptosporidium canis TaxID=195482 RepID=A0ABQ8P4D2_9CRYT|nr:basal transcriptional activator hABT1 and RRM domain-containing protein [Cryptosporidium canis]KAJ1610149.1 basal transcriptional activator hABT1 and RRM domain-containing protein [Cryptosporidium canis]
MSDEENTQRSETKNEKSAILSAFENVINDEKNRGVIYISRIPPKMQPHHIREIMSRFGEVDRIFLRPEDKSKHEQRVKMKGGNYIRYIDGWIEFKDKKIAKLVASSLNNTNIGGKKRHNAWRDDIWCIRYLSNFKWHNLTEHSRYLKSVRKTKLQARISQVQKENNFYLQQVEKAHRMSKCGKPDASGPAEEGKPNSGKPKAFEKPLIESNESRISQKSLTNLL